MDNAAQSAPTYTPEAGASLRMLRWVPFVPGEGDAWKANAAAFTEATGVAVQIDQESWEDVRPKAAVAANVGSGPDMVMSWFDDPFQYPDKLLDVTDTAAIAGVIFIAPWSFTVACSSRMYWSNDRPGS